MNCKVSIYLAYAMLAYIVGSVMYLICTRFTNTPLVDSYTDEQIVIRRKSADKRRNIFGCGMLLACVLLYIVRPFKDCECV
jgi:hypothetical protein